MFPLLVCALLVMVLGLAVLSSMVLENWGRWRVELPAPVPAVTSQVGTGTGAAAAAAAAVAVASDPDPDDLDLVIPGQAAGDRAVAVLFAAYAALRLPEANRAAAWVTASARPPGPLGDGCPPGIDLRARPVAAGRLLDCADQGRCWVTLSAGTDIGRGLRVRPPTCSVLRGCAVLWQGTRAAMTRLEPEDVVMANAAVAELAPRWGTTTGAPDVVPIAAALEAAAAAGSGLVIRVSLGVPDAVEVPDRAGDDRAGGERAGGNRAGDALMALSD